MTIKPQSRISIALALLALVSVQSGAVANEINDELISIIQDVEAGWEHGDGTPFREHFLDFEGARYIESGMGYASAMAWVLFIIIMAITWAVFRTHGKWVHYGD